MFNKFLGLQWWISHWRSSMVPAFHTDAWNHVCTYDIREEWSYLADQSGQLEGRNAEKDKERKDIGELSLKYIHTH